MERGVLCDVFVAVKPHLYISGFLDLSLNTTVTFWFLSVSTCSVVDHPLVFEVNSSNSNCRRVHCINMGFQECFTNPEKTANVEIDKK